MGNTQQITEVIDVSKKKQPQKGMPRKRVREHNSKLERWQERLAESDREFGPEVDRMDERERLYNGTDKLKPLVVGDTETRTGEGRTSHVRNIIFENIESQISSSIPQPKVTPRRKKDEHLADVIERFLRNELDRLPFETMNDMAERTVPIQGAVLFLVDWDNTRRTTDTVGEEVVSVIHPKQLAPQPGVYTGMQDMDWFILKIPTTKDAIRRKYGVDVYGESESEPEIRSTGEESRNDEALTQYIGYELGVGGKINRYSWVNDIELEDRENYQARRQPVCSKCGKVRPLHGQLIRNSVMRGGGLLPDPVSGFPGSLIPEEVAAGQLLAGQMAGQQMDPMREDPTLGDIPMNQAPTPEERYDGGPCPWCGGDDFTEKEMDYEEVILPIETKLGSKIPGEKPGFDENGMPGLVPTKIPFYVPNTFPVVLQKSVSVFGQLLGNSDVDAITDQQNTTNRIEQKIINRLLKAGSRITLPDDARLRVDSKDQDVWYLKNVKDKSMIDLYEFKGDLQFELAYLAQVYEEARQILGITDSFQGRRDPTATSGKAKEYSAAMAAGRLESKRVMKNAAYAALFEMMFKTALAYCDEPRPVAYKNSKGETEYEEFNRYDFLEKDANGQWHWNDRFLFSCDTSAPLASNREAMWQETRMNLQTGAFGDPASTETLILFWSKMEMLHYPDAGATKKYLEEKLQREQQAALAQAQAAQQQAQYQQVQQMQSAVPTGTSQTPSFLK